jgi:predicted DNA-binding protein (MmcQ/YjbR family)
MDIESLRNYCLSLPHTSEGFPFDNKTLVFKVAGKMFALTGIEEFNSVNLKCEPERAISLREQYPCVKPGYHMSKTHWNTVEMDNSISDQMIYLWVRESYDLVVDSLTKKLKVELGLI